MYINFIKPILDRFFAFFVLLIFSPIMTIIVLFLIIFYRGNPFFMHLRPGKNAKTFKLIKFRTMRDSFDGNENPLPDKVRITSVGRFIRSTSIDELPQLFNVLKGDMSLVGPRPLLVSYLPLYNKFQQRRHEVKPGITGWTQVNGRNSLLWKEKFELDVWYVDNISFLLDIKIIILTLIKVFSREGINLNEQVTMEPFEGNVNDV